MTTIDIIARERRQSLKDELRYGRGRKVYVKIKRMNAAELLEELQGDGVVGSRARMMNMVARAGRLVNKEVSRGC